MCCSWTRFTRPKEVTAFAGAGVLHTDDLPIIAYNAPRDLYKNTRDANMTSLAESRIKRRALDAYCNDKIHAIAKDEITMKAAAPIPTPPPPSWLSWINAETTLSPAAIAPVTTMPRRIRPILASISLSRSWFFVSSM